MGCSLFLQTMFLKNIQCSTTSILFTYCIINTMWYSTMSCIFNFFFFFCRTTYRVLCLGWYKTCRGSQGFSTHNFNSWAFNRYYCSAQSCCRSVLYCLVVFLFIMLYPYHCLVSQSLVIIVFRPLLTNLIRQGNPLK